MTKKQGYSTVVCFVLTCIIAIILFMNGFVVHAEGSSYIDVYGIGYDNFYLYDYPYLDIDYYLCMTSDQYQSSSIYDSSVSSRMVSMQSLSSIDTYIWNHQDISNEYFINVLKTSIPSDISPSEYPYFVMSKSSSDMSDNAFDVYFLSANSNLICFSSYGYVSSEDGSDCTISAYTYSNGTYTEKVGYTNPVEVNSLSIGTLFYVYYSNMPILVSDTAFSNFYDGVSYFRSYPENFIDQNYLLYDAQGEPNYTNPNLSGGGSGSESAENNMYLQFPKWYFYNITKFDSLASYYLHKNSLGSATFNCKLTDYQKEHLNEFSVKIDIQTYVDFDQAMNDGTVEHNKKIFDYPTQTISLSDFYSNSNNYNVLISDIFESSVSTDAYNNSVYLGSWLESYDNIYQDTLNKLQGKFTATLISNNNNNSVSSGACTYTYDYMTGKNMMNDNTLGTNPNPDLEGDQGYNGFDDDNSQSVSNGGNTLINNDNDTINFNGNGDVAKDLYHEIIPTSGEGGLSESIQESFNTNGWLTVMRTVFSFVPEEVFDTIAIYVISALGICVAGFALRIVLDLL